MDNIINHLLISKPYTMANYTMKTCALSGKTFRATEKNFYRNNTSADGFHSYAKPFDNFRRTTGITATQVRDLINLLK
jgi:hypothetical protein